MNNHHGQLLFPRLVRKAACFAQPSKTEENRAVPIYQLDWTAVDEAKKQGYLSADISFHPLTTPEWTKQINTMEFVIRADYKKYIFHYASLAQEEWSYEKPFDARASKSCLDVAIKSVYAAFYQLADCFWDSNSNRWKHGDERDVLRTACLIRFWDHQIVDRRDIREYSGLDKLEQGLEDSISFKGMPSKDLSFSTINLINNLTLSFDAQLEKEENECACIPAIPSGSGKTKDTSQMTIVKEPSIGFTIPEDRNRSLGPVVPKDQNRTWKHPVATRIIVRDEGTPGTPGSNNVVLDSTLPMPDRKRKSEELNGFDEDGSPLGNLESDFGVVFSPDPESTFEFADHTDEEILDHLKSKVIPGKNMIKGSDGIWHDEVPGAWGAGLWCAARARDKREAVAPYTVSDEACQKAETNRVNRVNSTVTRRRGTP